MSSKYMIDWNLPFIFGTTKGYWKCCNCVIVISFHCRIQCVSRFSNWMLLFICSMHIFGVKITPNTSISFERCGNGNDCIAAKMRRRSSNKWQKYQLWKYTSNQFHVFEEYVQELHRSKCLSPPPSPLQSSLPPKHNHHHQEKSLLSDMLRFFCLRFLHFSNLGSVC